MTRKENNRKKTSLVGASDKVLILISVLWWMNPSSISGMVHHQRTSASLHLAYSRTCRLMSCTHPAVTSHLYFLDSNPSLKLTLVSFNLQNLIHKIILRNDSQSISPLIHKLKAVIFLRFSSSNWENAQIMSPLPRHLCFIHLLFFLQLWAWLNSLKWFNMAELWRHYP